MHPRPLKPGSTIGILGGGQLGRFLAISAAKLGFKSFVYAPEEDSPAFHVAFRKCQADYEDERQLTAFAKACDVVTFEFENVPAAALKIVGAHCPLRPSLRSAEVAQDRIAEKRFLSGLSLPVAPYTVIQDLKDVSEAGSFLSSAANGILKTSREGYDGKGQKRISNIPALEDAFEELGVPCVLEAVLEFTAEISVIAVRSVQGELAYYDTPENTHQGGILRTSKVPAAVPLELQAAAKALAGQIATALDYVGVLGVELFVMPEGSPVRLMVNEIAPRVHNSGHWTLDACLISQFENHIRAVAGWPLGATERHSNAVMTNLLGSEVLHWQEIIQADSQASLHLYGKNEIREGRKLGHVTKLTSLEKR